VARYGYDKNSNYSDIFWKVSYVSIARANDILSVADGVIVEDGEEVLYNDLLGQLHAMRGLLHFDLARTFCQLPTALHDGMTMTTAHGGLPISDQKFPVDHKPVRATLEETYNFIIDEFNEAIGLLNPDPNIQDVYGYFNIVAAKAIKAKVLLYMGDYNNAKLTAIDAMNSMEAAGFGLATRSDYNIMWGLTAQPEFLLEFVTTSQYNGARNSVGYYSDPDGYGEFGLTDAFVAFISSDPNDIRNGAYREKVSQEGQGQGYYPDKYPGRLGTLYINNPRVIRVSEVYLIAAEAAFHNNEPDIAAQYINELRDERIAGNSNLTSVTLTDILNERRRELFAEGERSFDVWRNKLSLVNLDFSTEAVNYDNYRTIMAIPERETDISPELRQNQGWE
ncbi:MAG: RagB/SusD family nutrient uptake outer membrane protein, partial [Bacteroidales bacterium]|nr:RagB/SusD family nutrient uptake outer membrane protein [Bacteroidales bacterium]